MVSIELLCDGVAARLPGYCRHVTRFALVVPGRAALKPALLATSENHIQPTCRAGRTFSMFLSAANRGHGGGLSVAMLLPGWRSHINVPCNNILQSGLPTHVADSLRLALWNRHPHVRR